MERLCIISVGKIQKRGETMKTEMDMKRQLGRKLTECGADKGKIALRTGLHFVFCILMDIVSLGGIRAIRNFAVRPPDTRIVLLDVVLTAVISLYPLIHLREYLAFYEYGIVFRKKAYLWSELGAVEWRTHTYGGIFTSVVMATNKRAFQVTYLKQPKKQYNRAYMHQ